MVSRSFRKERIPQNSVFLWSQSGTLPTNFTQECSLDNKYTRVVPSCGTPGCGIGSATHQHSSATHTHTASPTTTNHSHTGNTTGATTSRAGAGGLDVGRSANSHPVASTSSTPAVTGAIDSGHAHCAFSTEPSFKTIRHIKFSSSIISVNKKNLPLDSIVIFPRATSFPSKFSLETSFDNLHLKGSCTPGSTGGSNTHTHNSEGNNVHAITIAGHTHTINSLTNASAGATAKSTGASCPTNKCVCHGHSTGSGSYLTNSGSTNSVAAGAHTHDSVNHEPLHTKVSLLKVTSIKMRNYGIEKNIVLEWVCPLVCIPSKFQLSDGTNGTVDLRCTHLKPSCAGVGCTAGSDTHQHASSGCHSHSSTSVAHSHAGTGTTGSFTCGAPCGSIGGSSGAALDKTHSHSIGTSNSPSVSVTLGATGSHQHDSISHLPDSILIAAIERL